MSSDDIAIRIDGVSKHYVMFERPEDRLKQMVVPHIQRLFGRPPKRYYRDFAAVNDTSFIVRRGETVGIIGRNGSGKSTMLQMVCGTLQPTWGNVEVKGRIAALLELGAGFNPEFTGRENVYINAAILGLSHAETDAKFDEIERFADIGIFIDQPVKTYSSGMYLRLAFAVAINVEPDILVIDEALSVGDEAFQRKCFARIEAIRDKGATILFVSHGAQTIVQLCDRAMLFDRGEIILEGLPKTVVNQYQRFINLSGDESEPVRDQIKAMDGWVLSSTNDSVEATDTAVQVVRSPTSPPQATVSEDKEDDESWYDPNLVSHSRVEYESKGARISNVRITTSDGRQVNVLKTGKQYLYRYRVEFDQEMTGIGFGMMIKSVNGTELGGAATDFSSHFRLKMARVGSRFDVCFELRWSLNAGTYFLNAGITGSIAGNHAYSHRILDALSFRILPTTEPIATGTIHFDPRPTYWSVSD